MKKKNTKTQSHFDETDQMALFVISTAKCETFFVSRMRMVSDWMQRKNDPSGVAEKSIDLFC